VGVVSVLAPNTKVVFAGDSITDAIGSFGHNWSYEHGCGLGEGWVSQSIALIGARYPGLPLRYLNSGRSGIASRELRARWDELVMAHEPDVVTLLVGMNDLNLVHDGNELGSDPDEYGEHYEAMARAVVDAGARLILLDSFYLWPESGDVVPGKDAVAIPAELHAHRLARLPDYLAVVHKVAADLGVEHIPLHDLFQEQLRHRPSAELCDEPVHPNDAGHLVIAHAFLRTIGW
jgi:lysophospholipase L1-like esterase